MAALLRRVSLRRAFTAAASSSSHPEVQHSVLSAVFNGFCDFGLGWVGEGWVPGGMIDMFSLVFLPC